MVATPLCKLTFLSEPACPLQLYLHCASVFDSLLRTWDFNVIFSFVNWILSGNWSRNRVTRSKCYRNQPVFLSSIYIEPVLTSCEECNEFVDLMFWRLSLCLSRDSLSCDTLSLDLCISFKSIFLHFSYILRPILTLFTHFAGFTLASVHVYNTTRIFFNPWWCCWAKARNRQFLFLQQLKALLEKCFTVYSL